MTRISMALWILDFILAPTLYGQTLDELYAKEAALNKYSRTIIHYEWVRDRHFGHDSPINRHMASILDDVALWYHGYQALSEIGPVGDLDRIVTDIAKGLRLQGIKTETLLHWTEELMVLLDRTERLLAENQNTPDHPDFSLEKAAIIRQRQNLGRRINKLKNIIRDLRNTIRTVTSGFGYDFFSAKLKAVSLAKGISDAEPVLAGYKDFIKAELTAGPWLGHLEHESRRAIGHMIALEFHSARASLETLKTSYQNISNELESSSLHPTEAARIRAELESYVHEATSRYQQTIEPYPDAILGQSMQRLKLRKFRNDCKDSQPSSSQRCDLLSWLRDIEPASVKTFDTKKLEDLESKWQLVESSTGAAI